MTDVAPTELEEKWPLAAINIPLLRSEKWLLNSPAESPDTRHQTPNSRLLLLSQRYQRFNARSAAGGQIAGHRGHGGQQQRR